jgi:hypothetical protein
LCDARKANASVFKKIYVRMRSLLLGVALGVGALSATAQDLDYPDYRSKKDNFLKVQEKDVRNDLATFTMAGVEESISKLPLKSIPLKDYGRDFMKFEGNGLQVIVKTGRFDSSKHKLIFMEGHLVKIDKKAFYGSYGSLPKMTIESITVLNGKDTIPIPVTAYNDLYDPSYNYYDANGVARTRNAVYLSADNRRIYIYLLNPVQKNEYTWVIQDKQYLRRVVDWKFLN